jgi:hypothetical protein
MPFLWNLSHSSEYVLNIHAIIKKLDQRIVEHVLAFEPKVPRTNMFFPRWEKPSPEVIKLNTDAAFLDNAIVLSVVVRDENGLILMARTRKVPSLISVAAQAVALL